MVKKKENFSIVRKIRKYGIPISLGGGATGILIAGAGHPEIGVPIAVSSLLLGEATEKGTQWITKKGNLKKVV